MIKRLIRLITLYEEQRQKAMAITPIRSRMSSTNQALPPLPPRRLTNGNSPETNISRITDWVNEIPMGVVPRSNSVDSRGDIRFSQIRSSTSTRSSLVRDLDVHEQEHLSSFEDLNQEIPRETVSQRAVSEDIYNSFGNLRADATTHIKLYENLRDEFGSRDLLRKSTSDRMVRGLSNHSINDIVERKAVTAATLPSTTL
jgi:hypothetical protein